MVSVCLPSDTLLQHLPSYLGFSYLRRGVSLHGCSSKAQPFLLTLDEGYLFSAALPDLQRGQQPRVPDWDGAGTAERSYPTSEVRGSGQEELPHAPMPETRGRSREEQPMPEARGGGREDQTHVQGAVAERAQEGLEELSHTAGQEGQR